MRYRAPRKSIAVTFFGQTPKGEMIVIGPLEARKAAAECPNFEQRPDASLPGMRMRRA